VAAVPSGPSWTPPPTKRKLIGMEIFPILQRNSTVYSKVVFSWWYGGWNSVREKIQNHYFISRNGLSVH
jgi:hypothetical protein